METDWKKRYNEALERARALREEAIEKEYVNDYVKDYEAIFPELRESEDERIRKWIIAEIKATHDYDSPTSAKCVDDALAWLKSLRPQPQLEWSEDWREEDIQTRFAFYTYKDDPSVLYLSNVFVEETSRNHGFGTRILRAAEKVAEAIGATTISLKVKQNSPANAWYRKNGYGYVAFEDGYDWLEKNLEYMKPNKQEWSENDSRILYNVIAYLGYAAGQRGVRDDEYKEAISWLKSLRPPQYCENCKLKRSVENWKPSKEQMGMLLAVINDPNNAGAESCHLMLQSLFADLQKLLSHEIH